MARLIGDAYIVIYPQVDPATFRAQAEAGVKKALTGAKPNINVGAQLDPAEAAKLRAQIDALLKNENVNVGAQINPADVAKLRAQIDALTETSPVRLETGGAVASLEDLAARTGAVRDALLDLRANVDDTAAEARLAALTVKATALDTAIEKAAAGGGAGFGVLEAKLLAIEAAFDKINADKIDLKDAPAIANLTALADRAGILRTQLQSFRAVLDDAAMEAKLAALEAQAAKVSRAITFAPADADTAGFEAQLLAIAAGYGKIRDAQAANDAENSKTLTFWNKLGLAGAGSLTNLREVVNAATAAGGGVRLFAGAIDALYSKVTGGNVLPTFAEHLIGLASPIHLATEAVIEFIAIWAPALIALSVFSAAAVPTVLGIAKQLQNMNTAAQGTGKSFEQLSSKGQSLVAAVQPSVLEAFGIGLYAIQGKASDLADVMKGLGSGIDQFVAKAAIAFDANTTGKLFKQGSDDVLALMDSFQQLGSIVGSLLKVVPGYAEVLLGFGNDILGFASKAVGFLEPILADFLKLHGAVFYGGLAGTFASSVFGKIVDFANTGATALEGVAVKYLGEESKITKGAGALVSGLESLGSTPVLLGIGLVVGAIAAIAIYLKASSNAAKDFGKTVQSALSNTAVTSLPQALAQDLTEANAKLTSSQQQYAQAVQQTTKANQNLASQGRGAEATLLNNDAALQKVQATTAQYGGTVTQLTQQQKNLNLNLGGVAALYGTDIPGALALANGAQVTANQLLGKGGDNFEVISTMIAGYITQLKIMVPGTGALNQALNALNVTQSQQVTNAQKVASAYQSWIGIVTGGDSAFTTFEQQQVSLVGDLNGTGASSEKLTVKVGNLSEQFSAVGAKMNGTSAASLAARQAFDQQINSAEGLYANLQSMSVVSGSTAQSQKELASAGKDLVAQLLPLAAGSKTATAEVYALAQITGYQGPQSFQDLAKWVGNTKGAEQDLDKQTQALTVSSANLTQAAKNLSSAMSDEVSQGEAAAITKSTDLKGIQDQLANSLINTGGKITAQSSQLTGQYYEALLKAGNSTTEAKDDVDAFLTKLGATPDTVRQVNAALATLPQHVNILVSADVSQAVANVTYLQRLIGTPEQIPVGIAAPATFTGGLIGAAKGMTVPGTSSSVTHDNHVIAVKSGELIIPSQHAPKFRDAARKASVPGFSGGGMPVRHFDSGGFTSDPVYSNLGTPYSYATPAPVPDINVVGNPGLPGATQLGQNTTNQLLQMLVKAAQTQPQNLAVALSNASAQGVRRGWFATSG